MLCCSMLYYGVFLLYMFMLCLLPYVMLYHIMA